MAISIAHVTAVGGTSGLGAETAIGLGSGGFSNCWARPSWQKSAVEIIKSTKLPSNPFNATGRGFPDISAQAIDFVVVMLGIPLGEVVHHVHLLQLVGYLAYSMTFVMLIISRLLGSLIR